MSAFTYDYSERPEWPIGINLPAGQTGMTDQDWIDYINPIIEALDASPDLDARVDDLRAIRAWLAARA